ncbi:hypothetical protein M103_4757 [Bacteroides fragilis str. 1007-1-F |nr:hypothetical protein M103_4757 [Bacteroides fragilis str. 1007-1-F \
MGEKGTGLPRQEKEKVQAKTRNNNRFFISQSSLEKFFVRKK